MSLMRSRWAAIGAAVAVTLGAGGLISVSATNTASTLVPIEPVRILDTRSSDRIGSLDVAGISTPYVLTISGDHGIPSAGISGISLNVTVVDTLANEYGGFLSVYPCESASDEKPDVSNINFGSGDTIANAVTVSVSDQGQICLYVYGTAHLLVDANGYYTASSAGAIDAYTKEQSDDRLLNLAQGLPMTPTLLASDNRVGEYTSIAIGLDQNPVISFVDWSGPSVDVATCNDPVCSSASVQSIDDGDAEFTSIAVTPSGLPIISYRDTSEQSLKIAACSDPRCVGDVTVSTVDNSGNVGFHNSIAIGANGNAVISYADSSDNAIKVAVCANSSCSESEIKTIDNAASVFSSLAISESGNPVVAFGNSGLRIGLCSDPTCDEVTVKTLDSTADAGFFVAVTIGSDGNPVVSHYNNSSQQLLVSTCSDTSCSGASTAQINDSGNFGSSSSIVVGLDGMPVIAYNNVTTGNLMIASCENATCTSSTITTLDSSARGTIWVSVAVARAGNPIISYFDNTDFNLMVVPAWALTSLN